ncbi:MAG: primosomal replication protein N [Betaproteobacteria bacterium]|nr:primosomal replication protein N [Betaproteobacteria bacterium]
MTEPGSATAANRLRLQARLIASDGLRHTPAGIPVVDATLAHQSAQSEAGLARTVELELATRFAGALAVRVATLPMGVALRVEGFLAPRRRQSRQLVLHVNEFELIEV